MTVSDTALTFELNALLVSVNRRLVDSVRVTVGVDEGGYRQQKLRLAAGASQDLGPTTRALLVRTSLPLVVTLTRAGVESTLLVDRVLLLTSDFSAVRLQNTGAQALNVTVILA